jgi:hypothetical protein
MDMSGGGALRPQFVHVLSGDGFQLIVLATAH